MNNFGVPFYRNPDLFEFTLVPTPPIRTNTAIAEYKHCVTILSILGIFIFTYTLIAWLVDMKLDQEELAAKSKIAIAELKEEINTLKTYVDEKVTVKTVIKLPDVEENIKKVDSEDSIDAKFEKLEKLD